MALYFYDIDNTNPSIVYSTGWNEYPDVKAYGGSVTSTFSQATASFSFTGTHRFNISRLSMVSDSGDRDGGISAMR